MNSRYHFPWIGLAASVFCTLYFISVNSPDALPKLFNWQLSEQYSSVGYQQTAVAGWAMIMIFEFVLYAIHRRQFKRQLKTFTETLNELLNSKRNLQAKLRTYTEQSDKLKVFISDRLLDFIEYDEKYLHFKNIASEVRHNGVISYDKVLSTLSKTKRQTQDTELQQACESATSSMMYLWDLLDLSTTDNISMTVANKLYAAEEHYYQQVLNGENDQLPFQPIFPIKQVVVNAFKPFADVAGSELPPCETGVAYQFHDEHFWLELQDAGNLLGNENYIHLILDNLINNALYYANNRKYKNKYGRIAVFLDSDNGTARLSVYGNGPLIEDDIKDQIFKLGFSTKRTKGHHGKGLGLYFIHEIVKGFEGSVEFTNIINQPDTYDLIIETADGKTVKEPIETVLNNEKLLGCRKAGKTRVMSEIKYQLPAESKSITLVSHKNKSRTQVDKLPRNKKQLLTDSANPGNPQWLMEILSQRSQTTIAFKPLNINGVQFTVSLPSAELRLDPEYHELNEEDISPDESLNKKLDEITPLIK